MEGVGGLQSPQLLPFVTLLKYHMILLSWFQNMCSCNAKAEQTNLLNNISWSQVTEGTNFCKK